MHSSVVRAIEADFEDLSHDVDCESEPIPGTPHHTPCGCERRAQEGRIA